MNCPNAIDGVLVLWGDRLFFPGNRRVRGTQTRKLPDEDALVDAPAVSVGPSGFRMSAASQVRPSSDCNDHERYLVELQVGGPLYNFHRAHGLGAFVTVLERLLFRKAIG
jgi:hypothetical protein